MTAGQSYSVSVTMKNVGTATWTKSEGYKLGTQNPQDNTLWLISSNRVELAAVDFIAPNQTKTFAFSIKAPSTAGIYNFQWKMLREGVGCFGALSTNVSVAISTSEMVDIAPPSVPKSLQVLSVSSSQINLNWAASTDNVGIAGYRIFRDDVQIGTSAAAAFQNSRLAPATTYFYTVAAYDATGNVSAQSVAASATIPSAADTIAPTASMTSPANGAAVSGNITISAKASDNVSVRKVEFYADVTLIRILTLSPYSFVLDVAQMVNGVHTLQARAYDAAGNVGNSPVISVTVFGGIYVSEVVTVKTIVTDVATLVVSTSPAERPISISIPAASFASDVVLSLKVPYEMPPVDPALNGAMKSTGIGLEITLDQAVQPAKAATIEITYTAAEMAGIDRTKLVLARYDEGTGGWIPLESVSYPAQNKVAAYTSHFSLFQLMVLSAGTDLGSARIYPNPFYPNKGHTQITMDGVPEGTAVKIYTLNGELVWEGKASSTGLVAWYGRNKAGRKAASGLYLVYLEHGGEKKIKKVSVVK
jgi:chitodextrinase